MSMRNNQPIKQTYRLFAIMSMRNNQPIKQTYRLFAIMSMRNNQPIKQTYRLFAIMSMRNNQPIKQTYRLFAIMCKIDCLTPFLDLVQIVCPPPSFVAVFSFSSIPAVDHLLAAIAKFPNFARLPPKMLFSQTVHDTHPQNFTFRNFPRPPSPSPPPPPPQ